MDALKGKYLYEVNVSTNSDGSGLPPKKRKPIHLTPKQAAIDWTPEMEERFNGIRKALGRKVSLYLPRLDARLRVWTDASDYAIGRILEQEQQDGQWHPLSFFSRKLEGNRDNDHKVKGRGQIGWTVCEKETYAVVCCLLKFQSWIGNQEVVVKTDHSSIVQWYKKALCTVSGPLGRRGRWHGFLSRFNLVIEYCKGENNDGPDALSCWAYPAGLAQDVSIHGSAQDVESWNESERQENVRSQQFLREQYPDTFGEYQTVRGCQVEGCTQCVPVYFPSPEEARDLLLRAHAKSELYNIAEGYPAHCPAFADEDGCLLFLRDCTYPHSAGRGVRKDFQIHCGSDLSAVEVLPLEPVSLKPDTIVLKSDWEEYYSSDPVFGPIWDELDSRGVSGHFRLHAGGVRFQGRISVPLRIFDDVITGVHTYAHPGVYKTHQLFNRCYIVHEVSGGAAVRKLQYHAL